MQIGPPKFQILPLKMQNLDHKINLVAQIFKQSLENKIKELN